MTRIVAGVWSGRRLITPAGSATRPTGEKVRAALGNSLSAGGALAGARVLDLYAGSGALALELLSRGAAAADLVENDRAALAAARRNVGSLQAAGARVVAADVHRFVAGLAAAGAGTQRYDVVVADPPYVVPGAELTALFGQLQAAGALAGGADLVIERPVRGGEPDWPEPLVGVRSRRYGDTLLCYGRAP
ncbi:RsmD family RNA methyltransferase [Nakamurella endophytica]|uniref:DNA methylase n=1 Tax=Nakamurella endophytica TaxID=1748367 RepID=A0A917T2K5_9ACTN|nr:RsmD family RNA methyltransferase [Nakamurella endophytica]GGM06563.1 DNA methylase [Nakamurella endophytica]